MFIGEVMADRGVDLSALPKEVRDQLAELDLELSEGKEGEGADGLMGGDALADFLASYVSQLVWTNPASIEPVVSLFHIRLSVYNKLNESIPAHKLCHLIS